MAVNFCIGEIYMKNLLILGACLLVSATGNAATCSDIGYYCQAPDRYKRVQYIETSGTQYLNTGIPLNSKYDMEMTWQATRFINDTWASGIWSGLGGPMIHLAGTQANLLAAAYTIDKTTGIDSNEVSIPFDTDVHTTYCYKDKGIWIDDESTLKPADYEMNLPSNANFLVGRRTNGFYWSGRIYSFVFKNNGQIMAEFIPVYDTQNEEYGMFDAVSGTFHGNLGSGAFTGADFTDGDFINHALPCANAPANAHYTGSGTDNNCPLECDTGYVQTSLNTCAAPCPVLQRMNISTKTLNAYAERQTQPALVLQYKNKICYINAVPGRAAGTLNLKRGDDIFHLVN